MVVFAVAMGARIVARAEARSSILAFTRDLDAGTIVQQSDVEFVRVALSDGQRALYVNRADATVGTTLDRPVVRGELVARRDLHSTPGATSVVIPLAAGGAPALHRGQRIVVWSNSPTCGVTELVHDVTIQSVDRDDKFAGSDGQRVVVDLPDDAALTVVKALSDEKAVLRAGVVSGPTRSSISPSSLCPDSVR
jgi:hypothetical protein